LPEHRFGITEFTTLHASFEEDLAAYRAAGADAIGICELKLVEGREREQLAAFRESGLQASACVPAVPSILPLPALPGPASAAERVEAIVAGMRHLAPFEPSAFVCFTGPGEEDVVDPLRTLADEASRLGVPLALEPHNARFRDEWTIPATLDEAAELAEEAGGGIGLLFDTWHLWETPDVEGAIRRHADSIVAVHVNDWREPTGGWCDRALPGEGVADVGHLIDALDAAGYDGFYDLEVFSDDGTFGNDYPGSLWRVPAEELARRGREAFTATTIGGRV
jgi:sugar phosphate isomerase/epimerase